MENRKSKNTIRAYQGDIDLFEESEVLIPASREAVERFLDSRLGLDSPATIRRRMASLGAYYRWALRLSFVDFNPVTGVDLPKIPKRLPKYLSPNQRAKINGVNGEDFSKFVVEFLCSTGLRVAELISLEKDSIKEGFLEVVGKGNKMRVIPVDPELLSKIPDNFFPYSENGIRSMLRRIGEKAGVPELHPHLCRHTFATNMAEKIPLPFVQELLGHESINTTMKYVHVRPEALRKAVMGAIEKMELQ